MNYLSDKDKMWQAEAMLTNAKQLRSSFEALSDRQRDRSLSWRFRPYEPLESSRLGLDHVRQIERSIHSGFYDESVPIFLFFWQGFSWKIYLFIYFLILFS